MTADKGPETVTSGQRLGAIAVLIGILVLVWFLVLRGDGNAPQPDSAQSYITEYGGSRTVVEVILEETDCATLQRTFDDADANREAFGAGTARSKEQLGRMAAADDRMQEIDC